MTTAKSRVEIEFGGRSLHEPDHAGEEAEIRVVIDVSQILVPVVVVSTLDHRGEQQLLAREMMQQP